MVTCADLFFVFRHRGLAINMCFLSHFLSTPSKAKCKRNAKEIKIKYYGFIVVIVSMQGGPVVRNVSLIAQMQLFKTTHNTASWKL